MRTITRTLLMFAILAPSAAHESRADDGAGVDWDKVALAAGSADPGARAQAIERARVATDRRALAVPIAAAGAVRRDRDRVAVELREAEEDLDEAWTARAAETRSFERLKSPEPSREEQHRRKDDALRLKIDELEAEADAASVLVARREEELESVRKAAASILARLPEEDVEAAIRRLAAAWLRASDATGEDRVRFVEAIERVKSPAVGHLLRDVALDARLDPRVRAAALDARAARREEGALEDAVLALDDAQPVVRAAAVDVLRTMHERDGIEPLIAFLGRDDLGRLREDACRALRSLTGERHGPYREPWATWWAAERAEFEMPRRPASLASLVEPERGLTFYGITTFSERVVFVLDTSGSMGDTDRAAGKAAARKVDVARKELFSALDTLGERARFGVILFDRAARRMGSGLSRADAPSRDRAHAWVSAREPRGETNLGDALRDAFRLASGLDSANPALGGADTIFLLTDGRPTAGGLASSDRIVEAVRRWNRALHLVIHCVGLGEHDATLLTELSVMTGGRYVRR